jgi:hypothetical protein
MQWQMNALHLGLLSRFVGMLTDSRSFMSYPRHELFPPSAVRHWLGRDIGSGRDSERQCAGRMALVGWRWWGRKPYTRWKDGHLDKTKTAN